VESGNFRKLSLDTVRRIAAPLDVQVCVLGKWRGGDGQRLLCRAHSLLAESFARHLRDQAGWLVEAEVSFSVYGERGVIDQLGWHADSAHLLVIELKTEFVDVNEMLGTLDRKVRLARTIAAGRGWAPAMVSAWLIVSDSRTNRRHAGEHRYLLASRFKCDGRSLASFLRRPAVPTAGLAFWTDVNAGDARPDRLSARKRIGRPDGATPGPNARNRPLGAKEGRAPEDNKRWNHADTG
jgi:hypothetical protein